MRETFMARTERLQAIFDRFEVAFLMMGISLSDGDRLKALVNGFGHAESVTMVDDVRDNLAAGIAHWRLAYRVLHDLATWMGQTAHHPKSSEALTEWGNGEYKRHVRAAEDHIATVLEFLDQEGE